MKSKEERQVIFDEALASKDLKKARSVFGYDLIIREEYQKFFDENETCITDYEDYIFEKKYEKKRGNVRMAYRKVCEQKFHKAVKSKRMKKALECFSAVYNVEMRSDEKEALKTFAENNVELISPSLLSSFKLVDLGLSDDIYLKIANTVAESNLPKYLLDLTSDFFDYNDLTDLTVVSFFIERYFDREKIIEAGEKLGKLPERDGYTYSSLLNVTRFFMESVWVCTNLDECKVKLRDLFQKIDESCKGLRQ